jgi:ethanolamine utilization protein EutA (predicted chaperonin)
MGVQFRQNPKNLQMKGVIATMAPGKQPTAPRLVRRSNAAAMSDPATTLAALAAIYGRIADLLLERIHGQADDLRHAQILSRHLDWVGARAQMIASFRQAGDCAMTYICASPDAYARLVPLVELTARQLDKPNSLAVALYLIERIDEELRLV